MRIVFEKLKNLCVWDKFSGIISAPEIRQYYVCIIVGKCVAILCKSQL